MAYLSALPKWPFVLWIYPLSFSSFDLVTHKFIVFADKLVIGRKWQSCENRQCGKISNPNDRGGWELLEMTDALYCVVFVGFVDCRRSNTLNFVFVWWQNQRWLDLLKTSRNVPSEERWVRNHWLRLLGYFLVTPKKLAELYWFVCESKER